MEHKAATPVPRPRSSPKSQYGLGHDEKRFRMVDEASISGAQPMVSLPEDTTGKLRSPGATPVTRPRSAPPCRSRPIAAYVQGSHEVDLCEDQTPEVSRPPKNESRRHSESPKRRRERTPPSDFDFPSELPLLSLSSLWLREESQRGTPRSGEGSPKRGTVIVTSGSTSSHGVPYIAHAKLQEPIAESSSKDTARKKPSQVHGNSKRGLEAGSSGQPSVSAQSPPKKIYGTSSAAKQEDRFRTYKGALAASHQRHVLGKSSLDSPERRVYSHHATFTPTRAFHESPSHGKRHAVGHRTPLPAPTASPSYSSDSLLQLTSPRERRDALTPTRDQLQNLYNTLMVLEHPPKRERLSRAAFRKKFFLPRGMKRPSVPPAPPRRRLGSATSLGSIRPADKGALTRGTDEDDAMISRAKWACMATCAAMALAMAVLAYFYLFRGAPSHRARQLVCATDDCRLHALFLDYNINNTFSPCADLDGHICTTWTPSQTYAELGATALRQVAVNWVENFLPLLRRGADPIKVAEKPLEMYEACMKERDDAAPLDAALFAAFLKELNLAWPERSGRNALGVLVNVAFSWQMTFWLCFRVRMVSDKQARFFILAGDTDALLLFAMNHRYVMQRDSYVEYWMTHFTALYGNASAPSATHIKASAVEQTDIIAVLTDARKKKRSLVTVVPAGTTVNLSGRITSSDWLEQLKTYLPEEQSLSSSGQVVGDSSLLEAIGLLFDRYSDEQLVYHLSWQFIQFYFLAVERTPLQIVHWGKTYSSAYVPVYCTLYVEGLYRPLLSAVHIRMAIAPGDTSRLNFALGGLMERLVSTINASQLEPGVKSAAVARYQSMQILIWPPGRYLNDEESEKAYSCYPTNGDSFVQYWIESHRCLQRTVGTTFHRDSIGMHRLLSTSPVTYDPIINEVAVAVSALAHPLYYPRGTPAMFYGGLGFLFVAEALKALDRPSLAIVSNATLDVSTAGGNDKGARCFSVQGNDTRATYFAALNIAYSAFLEDEANEVQERRRPISGKHSEKTVFFLTLCRMMCRARVLQHAGMIDCNVLFKNCPEFANAFACPPGSAMNPPERCFAFQPARW